MAPRRYARVDDPYARYGAARFCAHYLCLRVTQPACTAAAQRVMMRRRLRALSLACRCVRSQPRGTMRLYVARERYDADANDVWLRATARVAYAPFVVCAMPCHARAATLLMPLPVMPLILLMMMISPLLRHCPLRLPPIAHMPPLRHDDIISSICRYDSRYDAALRRHYVRRLRGASMLLLPPSRHHTARFARLLRCYGAALQASRLPLIALR